MTITRWKGKENMILSCEGVLWSLQKQGSSAIGDNLLDLEDVMLNEISQTQKDKYYMIPFL